MGRPGKFEGVPASREELATRLYEELPDDEVSLGGDAYVDWYGLYVLEPGELEGHEAVILNEDNQGFVTLRAYATRTAAEAELARLAELAESEDENEEDPA